MNDDTIILIDHTGRKIRLTRERYDHILEHPEMVNQMDKIRHTLSEPELIIASSADEAVIVYHRHYASTPVTSKFLLVAVRMLKNDAFVLTAFFSSRHNK